MPKVNVWVTGIDAATAGIMVETEHLTKKSLAKMGAVAKSVQSTAKMNMSKHDYTRRTKGAIKVGDPKVISKHLDSNVLALFAQEMTQPHWMKQMRDPATGRFMSFNPMMVEVPKLVTITVGIDHQDVPPFFVGSTFEHGWESDKQPPTGPIADWVLARGLASTPREAKRVAFVIARKMKQRGYSFGTDKWLSDAWAQHKNTAAALVSGFLG